MELFVRDRRKDTAIIDQGEVDAQVLHGVGV